MPSVGISWCPVPHPRSFPLGTPACSLTRRILMRKRHLQSNDDRRLNLPMQEKRVYVAPVYYTEFQRFQRCRVKHEETKCSPPPPANFTKVPVLHSLLHRSGHIVCEWLPQTGYLLKPTKLKRRTRFERKDENRRKRWRAQQPACRSEMGQSNLLT